jgi:REP element-mobilizing transposase RayT
MKQTELFKTSKRTWHGGTRSKGYRKEARPLSTKKWHHLVLKSNKAQGKWSFLAKHNKLVVTRVLRSQARKWGVEIKEWVNMGNHLHLKLRFQTRSHFQNFLRTVAALISRQITGAKKGNKLGRFWDGLAFTQVITSNYQELYLRRYFKANLYEKDFGPAAREQILEDFQAWVYRLRRRKRITFSEGPRLFDN